MQGGSITISNLGSLGGGAFTPIVNWPEVAILGVARARMEPVFLDGEFVPRFMMPLTLSYDHRVVDGADGVRILRWMCRGGRAAGADLARQLLEIGAWSP